VDYACKTACVKRRDVLFQAWSSTRNPCFTELST
jgi:hypothetical protein